MRRNLSFFFLCAILTSLCGCSMGGEKNSSLSAVYLATAILSLLLLVCYFCVRKKKDPWYGLLFISVLVVNVGYYLLSVSQTLTQALFANRLAYLGSVFLPLSILMIILNVTHTPHGKRTIAALVATSVVVFLITACQDFMGLYYQSVELIRANGMTVLKKVYGPLHILYLPYLLGYFTAMICLIIHSTLKDRIESTAYAFILTLAVFVNIGVWLTEQLVDISFEILSVSYIITECFLLGLHLLMAEHERLRKQSVVPEPEAAPEISALDADEQAQLSFFSEGFTRLTPKELAIYQCYVSGMSTAQIMEQLQIKENTLKFHNKNLYGKLGVSSRKQLRRLAAMQMRQNTPTE